MKFLAAIDMVQNQIKNLVAHLSSGTPSSPATGQVWFDTTAASADGRLKYQSAGSILTPITSGSELGAGSVANSALTTNPLARANHTGTQLAATVSDFDTQVRTSTLNQMTAPTADLSINSHKLTGVSNGSSTNDAVNYGQLQAAIQGFAWKQLPVVAASVGNGTLASAFENGDTLDGITLATGDRILLKDQSSAQEDGIYTVNASGAPTRAVDADTTAELRNATVWVSAGTANADTAWTQTAEVTTVNTTAQAWAQVGGGTGVTAGNGLTLTGATLDVGQGTGITVNANDVAVDTSVVVRKYNVDIGDNSSTSIAVTHSLSTKSVTYSVRTKSDDSFVQCDAVATSTSVLTLTFAVAPTTNQYNVTVHG